MDCRDLPGRAKRYYQKNGLKKTLKRMVTKPEPPKQDIVGFWDFIVNREEIPFSKQDYESHRGEQTVINWIVPEFEKGSGGHTTIFRFVSALERRGIHNRIYVYRPVKLNDESLHQLLRDHFQLLDERVESFCGTDRVEYAHATVATSWITAYFVRNFQNTISKFYFIQDFEPYFYAHGSEYSFAENTYSFGFRGITAGDWLRDIAREQYGMKAMSFHFSYDRTIYYPKDKPDDRPRVFFYARPVTPRRDWELGVLALHELYRRIPELEVVFAGWDVSTFEIPFPHRSMGVVSMETLADLYSQSDLCLVISSTNLSLVPLEVMGCGRVAVCSGGAQSAWMVNEENAVMVDFEPLQIAEAMEYYLTHPREREEKRQKGLAFAAATSWEREADKVYEAILEGIEEDEKRIS